MPLDDIGGILSATILTLIVLPILYTWFEREEDRDADITSDDDGAPPRELNPDPPLS